MVKAQETRTMPIVTVMIWIEEVMELMVGPQTTITEVMAWKIVILPIAGTTVATLTFQVDNKT